jgi:hypothetical protein
MKKRFLKISSYSHSNTPDSKYVFCVALSDVFMYHAEQKLDAERCTVHCTRVHYHGGAGNADYKLLYIPLQAYERLLSGEVIIYTARTDNSMFEYTIIQHEC